MAEFLGVDISTVQVQSGNIFTSFVTGVHILQQG